MNLKFLFLFKIAIVFSFLLLCIPNTAEAQIESELSELADDAMSEWGRSWSMDKYVRESATITSYRATSSGGIVGQGYFKFSRWGTRYTASMTIEVSKSGYVSEVCYTDPSSNMADCYNP